MDSTLLKYSAKDHFFKAALCHFCVDMLNAKVRRDHRILSLAWEPLQPTILTLSVFVVQLAVQKYEEMFPAFSDSRECKLLKVGPLSSTSSISAASDLSIIIQLLWNSRDNRPEVVI